MILFWRKKNHISEKSELKPAFFSIAWTNRTSLSPLIFFQALSCCSPNPITKALFVCALVDKESNRRKYMTVLILHIFHSLLTCSCIPSYKDKFLSMLVAMAIYGPYGGYLCYLRWLSMALLKSFYLWQMTDMTLVFYNFSL